MHRFLWDAELFVDVSDIADRITAARQVYGEPVEVVMVAPLTLIQKVIERGVRPFMARDVRSGYGSSGSVGVFRARRRSRLPARGSEGCGILPRVNESVLGVLELLARQSSATVEKTLRKQGIEFVEDFADEHTVIVRYGDYLDDAVFDAAMRPKMEEEPEEVQV